MTVRHPRPLLNVCDLVNPKETYADTLAVIGRYSIGALLSLHRTEPAATKQWGRRM